jgi:NTE family protein
MLREVMKEGIKADLVVGSSAGALNAAFYASMPNLEGIDKLAEIWRMLRRQDVFPFNLRGLLRLLRKPDYIVDPANLRR